MSLLPLLINLMHPCWLKNRSKQNKKITDPKLLNGNVIKDTGHYSVALWARYVCVNWPQALAARCLWSDWSLCESCSWLLRLWPLSAWWFQAPRRPPPVRLSLHELPAETALSAFLVPHTFTFSKLNLNMRTKPSDGGVKIHRFPRTYFCQFIY